MAAQVKVVGRSGQISLGKKYAGRTVLVEETSEGVWVIKSAQTIPDSELWLHTEPFKSKLEAALEWDAGREPQATDLAALEAELLREKDKKLTGSRG